MAHIQPSNPDPLSLSMSKQTRRPAQRVCFDMLTMSGLWFVGARSND